MTLETSEIDMKISWNSQCVMFGSLKKFRQFEASTEKPKQNGLPKALTNFTKIRIVVKCYVIKQKIE